ncbi:putative 26S proteasome non-ATPase regulatory subunit 10 [Cardiosporidium cionae]|uniref:26S proteasome non-ATPase regulatory subunit 10 n=1 Tax=Cardiosporidium cionae TaxID=476202 RepID=A0ABQ7JDM0_9APIC|nr:putative 26S proteasome non-ATPase regulatory subunit 10 [Cardiosporidium cionae]|eukprot:KAF8822112.1 putative 26S proteasome non-ATPase regulatory subunit 10 [Cardiosporidium cionae]
MENIEEAFEAARIGNLLVIQKFVEDDAGFVRKTDADERTAFHWACATNQMEIAAFLLFHSAEINHQDDGWSALHSSASAGHSKIVHFLLGQNAEVDLKTTSGGTPLHYAAAKGHMPCVVSLINAQAGVNATDYYGCTPFSKACACGFVNIADFLLKSGANCMTKETRTGDTPLHVSVNSDDIDMCLLICQHSPELLTRKNTEGLTPYEAAPPKLKASLKSFLDT